MEIGTYCQKAGDEFKPECGSQCAKCMIAELRSDMDDARQLVKDLKATGKVLAKYTMAINAAANMAAVGDMEKAVNYCKRADQYKAQINEFFEANFNDE